MAINYTLGMLEKRAYPLAVAGSILIHLVALLALQAGLAHLPETAPLSSALMEIQLFQPQPAAATAVTAQTEPVPVPGMPAEVAAPELPVAELDPFAETGGGSDYLSAPEPVAYATRTAGHAPAVPAPTRLYAEYENALRTHLNARQVYPRSALRRHIQGRPEVRFTVARDGSLVDAGLQAGSGYAVLDQAALRLVRDAAPYPPFPAELSGDRRTWSIPVDYLLDR